MRIKQEQSREQEELEKGYEEEDEELEGEMPEEDLDEGQFEPVNLSRRADIQEESSSARANDDYYYDEEKEDEKMEDKFYQSMPLHHKSNTAAVINLEAV